MAVSDPPEEDMELSPPLRLGRGGSMSCCSRGRSLLKKFSHAMPAREEGGGLAGVVLALARRAAEALTLARGVAEEGERCLSAAAELDEDDEAAELLLPEEELLPLLAGVDELLDDLEEESTDDETRREGERVDRGPQLEMKPLVDGDTEAAEGPAIAGAVLLCGLACLSSARAWIDRPRMLS